MTAALSGAPLEGTYDLRLVALSVIIAIFASGAALDLAGRVTARHGLARFVWLASGGVAMGVGIWSMHYTGMLAFHLPISERYDIAIVALSLLAAILASFVALFVASREQWTVPGSIVGSLMMGSGIAAMHYIGMAAMRFPAEILWNRWLVLASIGIAIAVSAVAMRLAFVAGHVDLDTWTSRKVGSALVMGAAIPAMHYTGMAAATFTASDKLIETTGTLSMSAVAAWAIGAGTVVLLLIAIGTSIADRRIMAQALALQAALVEVKTLRGMLPICANCKRIRTDQGSWEQIESYVRQHTGAEFSHGMCPDCARSWEAAMP